MCVFVQTFFGSEYLSPGKSCLELLTDYYVDITRRNGRYSQHLKFVLLFAKAFFVTCSDPHEEYKCLYCND